MPLDLADTIVALATATGPGGRAIVRLSGPVAFKAAAQLFSPEPVLDRNRFTPGELLLPGVAPLPADLWCSPGPATYTGQDIVEIHTISSQPLVELLVAQLLRTDGTRPAQPGEFTLRAFLGGKLDLTRAEAVLGVIEAGGRDELRDALKQLAGNLARPLQQLREDLLNLLADVEAGLDFADEDIVFVAPEALLLRLGSALAQLTLVRKQLEGRAVSRRPFRVALAGRPNAGKSSLFNALTGGSALVSPAPGTTRDYLVGRLSGTGAEVELIDTAGWQTAEPGSIAGQAQSLGQAAAGEADLVLVCVEAGQSISDVKFNLVIGVGRPERWDISTKCDLAGPHAGFHATSATTGHGLQELKESLHAAAAARPQSPLAPSLSRCRHHVTACIEQLRRAHQLVLFGEPPELAAAELRGSLDQLGELVGAVYTDDLLDRVFSRFCIGK